MRRGHVTTVQYADARYICCISCTPPGAHILRFVEGLVSVSGTRAVVPCSAVSSCPTSNRAIKLFFPRYPHFRVISRDILAPAWRASGRFVQQALAAIGATGGGGGSRGWSLLGLEALSLVQYDEVIVLDQKVRVGFFARSVGSFFFFAGSTQTFDGVVRKAQCDSIRNTRYTVTTILSTCPTQLEAKEEQIKKLSFYHCR